MKNSFIILTATLLGLYRSVHAESKGELTEALVSIVSGSEDCNPFTGCPKKYSSAEVLGVTGAAIDQNLQTAERRARRKAADQALQNAKTQAIAALPQCDAGCESGEVEASGYGTGVEIISSGKACDDHSSWLAACVQETQSEFYCLMELQRVRNGSEALSNYFAIASAQAWARASRSCVPAEGSDKSSCEAKNSVREIVEE